MHSDTNTYCAYGILALNIIEKETKENTISNPFKKCWKRFIIKIFKIFLNICYTVYAILDLSITFETSKGFLYSSYLFKLNLCLHISVSKCCNYSHYSVFELVWRQRSY